MRHKTIQNNAEHELLKHGCQSYMFYIVSMQIYVNEKSFQDDLCLQSLLDRVIVEPDSSDRTK